jgi:hypothetical protein
VRIGRKNLVVYVLWGLSSSARQAGQSLGLLGVSGCSSCSPDNRRPLFHSVSRAGGVGSCLH